MSALTSINLVLTPFEEQGISFFVEAAGLMGIPKSVAMIYGVLFGSSEPLSFSEIESKLDISKGSVSQGLRLLRTMGAVESVGASGESAPNDGASGSPHLVHYRPVVEFRVLLKKILAEKVQPHLAASGDAIKTMTEALPDKSDGGEILKARVKHLRAWHKRAGDLIPLIRTVLR